MRSRGTIGQLSLLGGNSARHNENAAPANAPTHTPSRSSVCISSALALNRSNKRSDPLLYFRTLPYKPDFKDLIVAHAFSHGFCAVTIPGMNFLNQSVKTRGFRKTVRLCRSFVGDVSSVADEAAGLSVGRTGCVRRGHW
jgi:hypothetical protein